MEENVLCYCRGNQCQEIEETVEFNQYLQWYYLRYYS